MPLDDPEADPLTPPRPLRIRHLIYGFGMQAQEEAILLAGGRVRRRTS